MKRILIVLFMFFACGGDECDTTTPRDGGVMTTSSGHEFYWDHYLFPLQIHIDETLSLGTKDEIYSAIEHWNDVVGAEVFQGLEVPAGNPEILGLSVRGLIGLSETELGRRANGEVRGQAEVSLYPGQDGNLGRIHSANVWLDKDLGILYVRQVLIHELGHVLTLEHDGDPDSMMYFATRENQNLTEEDINRVRNMME